MTGQAHYQPLLAYAYRPSPLQRREARTKLLLLLLFTVTVVTTPITHITHTPAFLGYGAILAIAIRAARLPLRLLFSRLLYLLPLLAGVALFIPFHKPQILLNNTSNFATPSLSPGLLLFLNVAIKSIFGTLATLLLTASTPFPQITAAMERLAMPRLVVLIFTFTYRYLFVLMEEAQRMKRARDSRCYKGRFLWQATTIGQMIGTLFLRSYERAERVHHAMLSRGYTMAPPSAKSFMSECSPITRTDLAVFGLATTALLILRGLPYLT